MHCACTVIVSLYVRTLNALVKRLKDAMRNEGYTKVDFGYDISWCFPAFRLGSKP